MAVIHGQGLRGAQHNRESISDNWLSDYLRGRVSQGRNTDRVLHCVATAERLQERTNLPLGVMGFS